MSKMANSILLGWDNELLCQSGSRLMYVGVTTSLMASQKRPVSWNSQPSVRRIPMRISQPFGCEKSFEISFRPKSWNWPHETWKTACAV